jgi:hypothetical protein
MVAGRSERTVVEAFPHGLYVEVVGPHGGTKEMLAVRHDEVRPLSPGAASRRLEKPTGQEAVS